MPGSATPTRFRLLSVCGIVLALAVGGLAIGLDHQPGLPARDAADAPISASSPAPSLTVSAQAKLGEAIHTSTSTVPVAQPSARPSPSRTSGSGSPSASASASGSSSASSNSALTATATAEYQTPKGANEMAWSEAILTQLADPLTPANIESLGYWMQNEAGSPPYGIVGANNPLNVSEPGFGGTPIKSEGGGYSLYSYPSVQDGVEATAEYLNHPYTVYSGIVAALAAGSGLSSSSLASEFSTYSGGGYTTVPDSWGASQGTPES